MENENKSHKIEQIMKSAMTELKSIIDVNTVIGTPIKTENETIIPISKVIAGFVAGGGEYTKNKLTSTKKQEHPFAGGSGSGFNIVPVGFLIKDEVGYKVLNVDSDNVTTTLFDMVLKVLSAPDKKPEENENEVKDEK